jgi:hypothetical protein
LEWFPFYVHRLTGDSKYRAMKDYHQAWYLNLLLPPGFLIDRDICQTTGSCGALENYGSPFQAVL